MVKTVESSQPEENYPKPYAPLTVQPPTTLPQDKKTYYFAPMKSDTYLYEVQFLHLLFSNTRLKPTHFPDFHFFSTQKKQETSVSIREKAKESHSYKSNQGNKTIQNTEQFIRTVNLYS